MLTAKYIDIEGNETLFEVIRVLATPNPQGGKQPIKVVAIEPNGHTEYFTSGTLFVMNETGSTVSRWLIIDEEETEKRIGKSNHPVFGSDFWPESIKRQTDKYN